MAAFTTPHPSEQVLHAYGVGLLDDSTAESVDSHLADCSDCRGRVADLSSDSFVARLCAARPRVDASSCNDMAAESGETVVYPAFASPPPEGGPHALTAFPQYRVIRELGRGGMGVVYLAHNHDMDRPEVLKIINQDLLARRSELSDRFLREIRAAARLNHPNIVLAYTTFQAGPLRAFAMEYVEGTNLAELVRTRGPLPVGEACDYARQAARGLQHAHEAGLVHRDVKPGNLMLTRKGQRPVVKVLDFGLAKALRETPLDGAKTQEGQALGTPDFNAPEQILNAAGVDIRADIYSLGCTLYYLLSGDPPYRGTNLHEICQGHLAAKARPLNQVRPEVPPELALVVRTMMAKEARRRYQTPAEVADALAPFCTAEPPSERTPEFAVKSVGEQPTWTRTIGTAGALSVLVLGTITTIVASHHGSITGDHSIRSAPVEVRSGAQLAQSEPPRPAEPVREGPRPKPSARAPHTVTNSVGMTLVRIPAGSFEMGSADDDALARQNEKPRHRVTLTRPFYLGTTEVTVGQFRKVVEKKALPAAPETEQTGGAGWNAVTAGFEWNPKYSWRDPGFTQTDDHPVVNVSWLEAVAFCNRLSEREEIKPYYQITDAQVVIAGGAGYRLPTEAEWEYACRAGSTTRFWCGDDTGLLARIANLGDETFREQYPRWPVEITARDGYVFTAPVGRFRANPWGLFDMHGNVWEWCWDGLGTYPDEVAVTDPLGPPRADRRVLRGGCFFDIPQYVRSGIRLGSRPVIRHANWGLRLARDWVPR